MSSLTRLKIKDETKAYVALLEEGWEALAVAYIIQTEGFKSSAPCSVMNWIEETLPEHWPGEAGVYALTSCASSILDQEEASKANLRNLATWLEKFPLDAFHQALAGKLYLESDMKMDSCRSAQWTVEPVLSGNWRGGPV